MPLVHSLTSTVVRPDTVSRLTSPRAPGKLRLRIDGAWYDLTNWQHKHPGGHEILQHLNGLDATDAFYSLHSEEAHERLKKFHSTPVKASEPGPSQVTKNFREFRATLVKEGWFERSLFWEAFYQLSVYVLALVGSYLTYHGHPWWAILCIGLAMQQAGWIGHDHKHGRGAAQDLMGSIMSGLINSFSPTWWSHKHNTHHVYTNHLGIDVDIENDPVFHLFFPTPENDVFYRKYQHVYFAFGASFLYISWRIQSLQWALQRGHVRELLHMVPGYLWLTWLGFHVALGSILLGGMLVALIVTVTHQSEDMIDCSDMSQYSFVEAQFRTTRDATSSNPVMHWLWGGMQFQLEHHLFPTMPKYWYSALQPRVMKFAAENGLDYRVDSVWEVWRRNIETLKFFAGPIPEEVYNNKKAA